MELLGITGVEGTFYIDLFLIFKICNHKLEDLHSLSKGTHYIGLTHTKSNWEFLVPSREPSLQLEHQIN
jgi:hypothetical protein